MLFDERAKTEKLLYRMVYSCISVMMKMEGRNIVALALIAIAVIVCISAAAFVHETPQTPMPVHGGVPCVGNLTQRLAPCVSVSRYTITVSSSEYGGAQRHKNLTFSFLPE